MFIRPKVDFSLPPSEPKVLAKPAAQICHLVERSDPDANPGKPHDVHAGPSLRACPFGRLPNNRIKCRAHASALESGLAASAVRACMKKMLSRVRPPVARSARADPRLWFDSLVTQVALSRHLARF